jgi:hypothetical protein
LDGRIVIALTHAALLASPSTHQLTSKRLDRTAHGARSEACWIAAAAAAATAAAANLFPTTAAA